MTKKNTKKQTRNRYTDQFSLTNLMLRVMAPSLYWRDSRAGFTRLARVRTWGLGYGGLVTSARALGAVLQDLLRPEPLLLSGASVALLLEPQQAPAGESFMGTLGWVTGELHGVPYFGKPGGGLGFRGNLRLYPSIGLGSAYLANGTAISPGPIDGPSDRLDGPLVRWLSQSR